MIGTTSENAASPMYGVSWVRISSAPYAEEEMQSGASTPRAIARFRRSPTQLLGHVGLAREGSASSGNRVTRGTPSARLACEVSTGVLRLRSACRPLTPK